MLQELKGRESIFYFEEWMFLGKMKRKKTQPTSRLPSAKSFSKQC